MIIWIILTYICTSCVHIQTPGNRHYTAHTTFSLVFSVSYCTHIQQFRESLSDEARQNSGIFLRAHKIIHRSHARRSSHYSRGPGSQGMKNMSVHSWTYTHIWTYKCLCMHIYLYTDIHTCRFLNIFWNFEEDSYRYEPKRILWFRFFWFAKHISRRIWMLKHM